MSANKPKPSQQVSALTEAVNGFVDDLRKTRKAMIAKNMALSVAVSAIDDAIAEGDCGEVSDFNLRSARKRIREVLR